MPTAGVAVPVARLVRSRRAGGSGAARDARPDRSEEVLVAVIDPDTAERRSSFPGADIAGCSARVGDPLPLATSSATG
jgi:hypothetical protein